MCGKELFLSIAVLGIICIAIMPAGAGIVPPGGGGTGTIQVPLFFIENRGEAAGDVEFQVAASGHTISFGPGQVVLRASQAEDETAGNTELAMSFPGTSASPEIYGIDRQPGTANFFIGNDSSRWRYGVPIFGGVEYGELYPGIDLRYRGNEGVLKREFVVAAGVCPDRIRVAYDGAEALSLAGDGSLAIRTPLGLLTDQAPVAYQEIDGARVPIAVSYRLIDDRTIGFAVGDYDPAIPLVIDPTLLYASFFGGSGSTDIFQVRTDPAGNIYLAGFTQSAGLPVQNAYQGAINGTQDAFIAELTPDGTLVIYLTYLGGSGDDAAQGLSVDGMGYIYLSGGTKSDDFPLLSPILDTRHEGTAGFVTKLYPSVLPASQLVYSTYLGGNLSGYNSSSSTCVNTIVPDPSGNAWIAGYTKNFSLPVTANADQPALAGNYESYLGMISPTGGLQYLTYLGGSLNEGDSSYASGVAASDARPIGLALDGMGNVYVGGWTASPNFPCLNAYDPSYGGGSADGFLVKYNPSGVKEYATFIGGNSTDRIFDIAADAGGAVYFTGVTNSRNFPTVNPAQDTLGGTSDNIAGKIWPSGNTLEYSTYWGGSTGNDYGGWGIVIDEAGNAYSAGITLATDFPVVNGTLAGAADKGFVVKFTPAGAVSYSTTLGGTPGSINSTYFYSIALNNLGDAIAGGVTEDPTYPVTADAYQAVYPGTWTGAIAIFTERLPPVANFTANRTSGVYPLAVRFNDTSNGDVTSWLWQFGDGNTSTERNPVFLYKNFGNFTVNLTATNSVGSDSEEKVDYINVTPPVTPTANFFADTRNGPAPLTVTFTDTSLDQPTDWLWNFGDGNTTNRLASNPVHTYHAPGIYTVSLTVSNSAGGDSESKFDYITVTEPVAPVANFTANVTIGHPPLTVQFNDTSENVPTSWAWDFTDDGSTDSTSRNASFTYPAPGLYSVNLTVANAAGSDSEVKFAFINVTEVPPVANFTANVTTGRVPLAVQFNDTSTGGPTAWNWTFGDGDLLCPFGDSQNPVHNYQMPGTYTVNLTASNAGGSDTESKAGFITVLPQALAGKIAVYRNGSWYLDSDDSGTWNAGDAVYGFGSMGWEKVVGDWDGDEDREIGVYQAGTWYLDENSDGGFTAGDTYYRFGAAGWQPVLGDWNGDRSDDIAVYRNGIWYLDVNGDGLFDAGDRGAVFGAANWTPVVGDWNGNGIAEIGVYRDGVWYLDTSGDGLFGDGDSVFFFGAAGWSPVVGNWDGDGATEIGVYNAGVWYLDTNGDGIFTADDLFCGFGAPGWTGVIGDWDSDGSHEIGVYQDSIWYVDLNGDGLYSVGDLWHRFGSPGWDPVVW